MGSLLEITVALAGIEIKQPYSGTILQVSPFECCVNGRLLPDGLRIDYSVSLVDHVDPTDQGNINLVLTEHADRVSQLLTLLIIYPFDYVGYGAKLDGVEVRIRPDPEPMSLSLYNLVAAFRMDFISTEFGLTVSEKIWPTMEQLLKAMKGRPPSDLNKYSLPLRWFEKASKEAASVDRMIAFWVAFNSLYGDTSIPGEQKQIKQYVLKSLGVVSANDFVAANRPELIKLSQIPVKLRSGREIATELASALTAPSPNDTQIMEKAALTIYAIRNHFFHGSWDLYTLPVRQHAEIAEGLLGRLLRSLIAGHILGHAFPEEKYVTWTHFGSKL